MCCVKLIFSLFQMNVALFFPVYDNVLLNYAISLFCSVVVARGGIPSTALNGMLGHS